MDGSKLIYYLCSGFCLTCLVLMYWYTERVIKVIKDSLDNHISLSDKLFNLRIEILNEMAGAWKSHYNRFLNQSYLDFLDQAYSGRFGTKNGWAFRLPPDSDTETIDLGIYFTDDEVEKIKKARDIYGDDLRLNHLDKRFGL